MSESALGERIATIPGHDGWWKSSSEQGYLVAARRLIALGMSEDDAIDLLDDLYHAAAECYGA
jgi:hypothetical protein